MKKTLLALNLVALSISPTFSQCEEVNEEKVLLIGDSWAFFMHSDETFNTVFDHWGFSNFSYISNLTLAVNGARAEDFLEEARLAEIENQLNANPQIEVVHMSLGGNDFLGNWHVDFTEAETEELGDETYDEVVAVMDFIKGVRPDIHIVYSGYMYANFEEVINDVAPFETSHPFYGNWEEMGFPTFEQLNSLLNEFSDRIYDLSLTDPQLDFMNVPALMQYVYGQEEPLGVDPGGTYAPYSQPLPYGDITYPSPKESMRDYGVARDCFHLSADGYFRMIDFQLQKFYHKFLMDDAYYLASADEKTGTVDAAGSVTESLGLGELDGLENQLILTFNTDGMADTTIANASLFLRREAIDGGAVIGETVELSMINGFFGTSAEIEDVDYDAEGEVSGTACVFGTNEEDTDWIRIDLPESFLGLIGNEGEIQFKITVPGASGAFISFTDGSDEAFAPVFNVKFQSDFVGVEEKPILEADNLLVFPNPATTNLYWNSTLENGTIVELVDIQGRIIKTLSIIDTNQIYIGDLDPGHYIFRCVKNDQVKTISFMKQ